MDVRGRDYLFVILASVFWGTAFPATKLIVDAVDPLLITAARLGMGALLGFGILAALRRLDWHFLRDPLVWVLGLLNALAFNLQNVGLVYTTASKTALLVNVNVVFIAILMAAVYKERVTGPRALGILLGLGGVVVLATKLNPAALVGGEFLGDALVFGSGLVWSFYILGVKVEVDRGGDYIALTATVLASAEVRHAGVASGVNNAVARAAGLLAVAGLPAVVGLRAADYHSRALLDSGFRESMVICAGFLVMAAIMAATMVDNDVLRATPDRPVARPMSTRMCAVEAPVLQCDGQPAGQAESRSAR
ncbi:MAG TPA: EamA family transporter [Thermoplasmata archaeon]|nr:EamA family transporter [Thermoplasmata archaeon]